ncbi:hypothetical protein VPH35_093206 [Triticum aestivum]
MAKAGAAVPEEETVVFPDWVMMDRLSRTHWHNGLDAASEAVNGNKTAVQVDMDSGHSFYVSFTLAPPPQGGASYLDLHWPLEDSDKSVSTYGKPAYPYDLVLFHVSIPSRTRHRIVPPDLFVYTAAGPSPSVQQLPLYTKDRRRRFLVSNFTTGILRRQDDGYIVADLILYREKEDTGSYSMRAELCAFNSKSRKWRVFLKDAPRPQDQSNGGRLPALQATHRVLASEGRFLCWVDYFSGIVLADFSDMCPSPTPALHFVPFPGEEEYSAEVRAQKCFGERYRSVSISQGKMRFVHIDNDLHIGWQRGQQPRQKITIWTLNVMDQYPVLSADDADALCCLLRKQAFHGEASMIMVDMNHASLRSCTPYINRQSVDVKDHKCEFFNVPLLPTHAPVQPWSADRLPSGPQSSSTPVQPWLAVRLPSGPQSSWIPREDA